MKRPCRLGLQIENGAIIDMERMGFFLMKSPDLLVPKQRNYETESYPEIDGQKIYPKTTYEQFDYKVKMLFMGDLDTMNEAIRDLWKLFFTTTSGTSIRTAKEITIYNYYKDIAIVGYADEMPGSDTFIEVEKGVWIFDLNIKVMEPARITWSGILIEDEQRPASNEVVVQFISPVPNAEGNYVLKRQNVRIGGAAQFPIAQQILIDDVLLNPVGWTHLADDLYNLDRDLNVGLLMRPTDGKTHVIGQTPLGASKTINLNFQILNPSGGTSQFELDWGDGSNVELYTTSQTNRSHSFTGAFHIKIRRVSGEGIIGLGSAVTTTSTNNFIGGTTDQTQADCIRAIYIGDNAYMHQFNNMRLMEHLVLSNQTPASVTNIYYLTTCTNLISLVIPPNFTTSVANNINNTMPQIAQNCERLRYVVFPDNIQTITASTMNNCYSLRSLVLPYNLSILNAAFTNTQNLKRLFIPPNITVFNASFQNCRSVEKVIIKDGIETLPNNFMQYCANLTDISLPDSLKSYGTYNFAECFCLPKITLPPNLTTMGSNSFGSTWLIEEVVVPEGVSSIPSSTFQNGVKIKIVLPSTTTTINSNAINGVATTKMIICHASVPPTVNSNFLSSLSTQCAIYVPSAVVEDYKTATGWLARATQILPMSSLT